MNQIDSWDHKWFGAWKEGGARFAACPSIYDFIDEQRSSLYDKQKISHYLETAANVAATSRMNFPCVITGKTFGGSLSLRTDGDWSWFDDLGHYVREHAVCLPTSMLNNIIAHNFKPPTVSVEQLHRAQWPPIGERQ